MVFLEQSPNFSLFPGDSANTNCFSLFLKLNFQSLRVTVDSCSPVGPASNSRSVGCLGRMGKLFVGRSIMASSLSNMAELSCGRLRGILEGGTDWRRTRSPAY